MKTRVAIYGAAGRMGQRLVALTVADPALTLESAVDHVGHARRGEDAGLIAGVGGTGVKLSDKRTAEADVVIDFSLPEGFRIALDDCVQNNIAMVVGTTGLTADDQKALDEAAKTIPLIQATNYSRVVNVLNDLAARAAKLLGDDYDIEVLEAHHRFKKDAPSGTALTLARVLCEATGRDFDKHVKLERHGDDVPRRPEEITVQTLRIGDHVGEHTVYLAALGERMEIKHVSTNRDSYAGGAIHAAKWLMGKPAGRYTMCDVLGL